MKFKINITTEDCELLNIIEIDTTEFNWDAYNQKQETANEIFDEIYRSIKRAE